MPGNQQADELIVRQAGRPTDKLSDRKADGLTSSRQFRHSVKTTGKLSLVMSEFLSD
jgi:hypothetical protein